MAVTVTTTLVSFNTGQVSPLLEARTDFPKYRSSCRTVENMFVTVHGSAVRRSGTRFVAEGKGETSGSDAILNYPTLQIADGTFSVRTVAPDLSQTLEIANLTDLQNMENTLDGNYYLSDNIDASESGALDGGNGFDPIGETRTVNPFTGTFDGNGFTITGLTINRSAESDIGLFGYANSATIKDVTLADIDYTGRAKIGGLLGTMDSWTLVAEAGVYNCHVTGDIVFSGDDEVKVGGMVGFSFGGVGPPKCLWNDCTSDVTIARTGVPESTSIGCFVGITAVSTFDNCRATGTITNGHDEVGGFAGYDDNGNLFNDCSANTTITLLDDATKCGGFSGYVIACSFGDSVYSRCSARGTLTQNGTEGEIGGFAGFTKEIDGNDASYTDCYSWVTLNVPNFIVGGFDFAAVGGFSGNALNEIDLTNCYAALIMSPIEGDYFGGFIGEEFDEADIFTSCYWDTETSGQNTYGTSFPNTPVPPPIGYSTTLMKTQATYIGWDFDDIWEMEIVTPGVPDFSNANVRLIPFTVSSDDSYVLEFGNEYIRVYRDDGS